MGSEPDIPALFVRSGGVSRLMRRQEHPQRENDLLSEHSQGTGGEGMGEREGIFFLSFFLSVEGFWNELCVRRTFHVPARPMRFLSTGTWSQPSIVAVLRPVV